MRKCVGVQTVMQTQLNFLSASDKFVASFQDYCLNDNIDGYCFSNLHVISSPDICKPLAVNYVCVIVWCCTGRVIYKVTIKISECGGGCLLQFLARTVSWQIQPQQRIT